MKEEIGNLNIWLPKTAGDTLKGKVLAEIKGQYGIQLSIDTGTEKVLTPSHKVLQSKFETGAVKVGDNLEIEYTGSEPPKVRGQNPIQMYKVFRL